MKKKLVFFIGGLNFGGMERVVFIASELLKNDYDITIATLYQTNKDYEIEIPLYDLDVPPSFGKINKMITLLKRLSRAKKMKKRLKPDIVFSFGMYSNYLNALTKGKEKIYTSIRSYDWLTKPFFSKSVDRYIMNRFDRISSCSKQIANDAEIHWNIPKEKNRVIYNPYDIAFIEAKAKEPVTDHVFEDEHFYVISVGRLSEQKAFHHLIKAVSICKKEIPHIKLIILGNGDLREKLQCLINELKLENDIALLGGRSNPYSYMKKANVYVLSSLTEGFPNALVEAMAVGTPVVSANCRSGPQEILFDEYPNIEIREVVETKYGILVPEMAEGNSFEADFLEPCDHQLAEGIIRVYQNDDKSKRRAAAAKKHIEDFNYSLFQEKLMNWLSGG